MDKNILITGSFSVGKSTTVEELAKKIPEKERIITQDSARWYMREHNLNANTMSNESKIEMQLFVLASYIGAIKQSTHARVIGLLDGSLIEALAYSQGILDAGVLKNVSRYLHEYKNHSIAYVIPPTIPLENDGLRHEDKEFRVEIHGRIMRIIDKYSIPYHIVTSQSVEERAEEILYVHNQQ